MFYEHEEMDVDNSIASNYPCLEKPAVVEKKKGAPLLTHNLVQNEPAMTAPGRDYYTLV